MAGSTERPAARKPRADAERNRLRLLEAAKAAFSAKGSEASLDEIARSAGVGIGTLYRHFPHRDALVAAVYRNETDQLVAAAGELAAARPPLEALRAWMLLFVDYIATKHGMYAVLNAMDDGTSELYAASGVEIKDAMGRLVDRATESGDIRLDGDPLDLLRALWGVANGGAAPPWQAGARRLVDILIAGIRAQSHQPGGPV